MADLNDIQLRIIVQGTGLDNLNRLNDTLAKATGNISASGAAATQAKDKWSQFGDALSHLERRFDAVFRAASHLQALGRDLTGMGEAGIGFLQKSVDAWGDYEFAVHRAAGALGIFDTQAPIFFNLQAAIDEVAREARLFPADEIAKAVYFWGSATGQTVKSNEDLAIVMKGLLPIMQTAAITETDYERAIKGTYQIIQQYNLGLTRLADSQDVAAGRAKYVGEELSNVRDVTEKLMMITQNTAVEYTDLIEAFRYTGTIAPALGVKYEDLLLVLGRLGDMGIRGSQAGRALQQMFTQLLDPTVRASKALDTAWMNTASLGKTFDELVFPNGEFIGITGLVDQLAAATENMTDKQRGELIGIITTQNEMRALVPLIEDQIRARREGINVYDQEKFSLENASAQFEKTMHLLEVSWKGTMGFLTNTVGEVVRAIGSEVAKMAQPFVEHLGKIMVQIRHWLDTHPEIVQWGVRVIAVASAVAILAGAFFTAVGVILAFGAGIAFVIKGLAAGMSIFPRFFPIIGAFIAIITALATNFGGLRDAAVEVWDALTNLAGKLDFSGTDTGVLSSLQTIILPALKTVAEAVAFALRGIADGLNWIASNKGATEVVQNLVEVLIALLALGAASRIAGIGLSILTLGSNGSQAMQGIKLLIEQMTKFGSLHTLRHPIQSFKELAAAIHLAGMGMKDTATSAAKNVISVFSSMAGGVATASRGISLSIKGILIASGIGAIIVAVGLLVEAWVNNWGDIQGKFAEVVSFIGGKFTEIGTFISGLITWFAGLPAQIGTFLSELWTNISTWIGQIVTTIVEFPGVVWQGLVDGFNNIMTFLSEWWTSLGDSTAERVGFIVGFILALPLRVLIEGYELWHNILDFLTEWFLDVLNAAIKWVGEMVGHIINWISKLPGAIGDFFNMIWTNLVNWWNTAIPAVGNWAKGVFDAVVLWISQLPGKIVQLFGNIFTNVYNWFTLEFIPNAGTWTMNFVNKIIEFVATLPGKLVNTLGQMIPPMVTFLRDLPGNIWDSIVSVGSGIIEGVWNGIKGAIGWFTDQVTGFFKGIVNGVKSALGIRSPSKVFAEIGTQMMLGLSVGIDKNHEAVRSLDDQVQTLIHSARQLKTEEMSALSGDFSFETDGTRKITLEHKVSSPDGTVNRASQDQLKQIFTSEDFVSALEHMVTVG